MDGKGRALDNVIIERFWRSLIQEVIEMSPIVLNSLQMTNVLRTLNDALSRIPDSDRIADELKMIYEAFGHSIGATELDVLESRMNTCIEKARTILDQESNRDFPMENLEHTLRAKLEHARNQGVPPDREGIAQKEARRKEAKKIMRKLIRLTKDDAFRKALEKALDEGRY